MDMYGLLFIGFIVVAIYIFVKSQQHKAEIERLELRRLELMQKYGDESIVEAIVNKQFWQGMSQDMLDDSLGPPADIGTKILKAKTVLTYKYDRTGQNRYGTRIRIENGIVVGWEQK